MEFSNYIENQENYFRNGNTLPISKRKKLLKNLKKEIIASIEFIDSILGVGAKDAYAYFQFGISETEKAGSPHPPV